MYNNDDTITKEPGIQIVSVGAKKYKKEAFYNGNLLVYKLFKIEASRPVILTTTNNFQNVLNTIRYDSTK